MIKPLFTRSEIADLRPLNTYPDRLIGLLLWMGGRPMYSRCAIKFVPEFRITQIETCKLLTHILFPRRVDGFLV